MGSQHHIRLFQTVEHACGYWPDRRSRDLIIDPVEYHPGPHEGRIGMIPQRLRRHEEVVIQKIVVCVQEP